MPLKERNIRQILKGFLLGNLDQPQRDVVDNWYESFDNENNEIFLPISAEETARTGEEIWARIAPETRGTARLRILSRPMKVAAMFILIAGAAGAFFLYNRSQICADCPPAFTSISTGIGEMKKIKTPDGSTLILAAGTTAKIYTDFSKERKIGLVDGQAFFDVVKDELHPFVIESQGLRTTVLGTSLNISAYKALNNLSIGVITGKVRVEGASVNANLLEKDQELVYSKTSKTVKTIPLDESMTAWQDGRILLNDLSFEEMTAIVKKNFGIDITSTEPDISNTRYTTELMISMSPDQATEVLAAIHNLRIKKKDNKFFLYK